MQGLVLGAEAVGQQQDPPVPFGRTGDDELGSGDFPAFEAEPGGGLKNNPADGQQDGKKGETAAHGRF